MLVIQIRKYLENVDFLMMDRLRIERYSRQVKQQTRRFKIYYSTSLPFVLNFLITIIFRPEKVSEILLLSALLCISPNLRDSTSPVGSLLMSKSNTTVLKSFVLETTEQEKIHQNLVKSIDEKVAQNMPNLLTNPIFVYSGQNIILFFLKLWIL